MFTLLVILGMLIKLCGLSKFVISVLFLCPIILFGFLSFHFHLKDVRWIHLDMLFCLDDLLKLGFVKILNLIDLFLLYDRLNLLLIYHLWLINSSIMIHARLLFFILILYKLLLLSNYCYFLFNLLFE